MNQKLKFKFNFFKVKDKKKQNFETNIFDLILTDLKYNPLDHPFLFLIIYKRYSNLALLMQILSWISIKTLFNTF